MYFLLKIYWEVSNSWGGKELAWSMQSSSLKATLTVAWYTLVVTLHMYDERFWNEQKNCEAIFCRSERLRVQIPVNSPVPLVHCQPIVAWKSPGRIVMGTGDLYPLQEPISVLHASLHVIMSNAVQDRGTYSWILQVNIYIFMYPFLCVEHYLNIEQFF